jgi:pilus assembly protein TadC
MAALISLVNVCELVNEVFFPEERKLARSRIKEIMQGDAIGQGVVDTVNGVQSAMMTAVIASTTASVSASCSGSASHCH